MSVETEIESMRTDVRALRSDIHSFITSFNADHILTLERLSRIEEWKSTHSAAHAKLVGSVEKLQNDVQHLAVIPGLVATVAALKTQNELQEGSLRMLKALGTALGLILTIASIINIFYSAKGH